VAYNSTIADATSMAPQLGTLSSTTTPTSDQAIVIWGRSYDRVRLELRRNSLSDTVTASSIAEGWAKRVEMLLTSGELLLAKGSIGTGAESTAQQLLRAAKEAFDSLPHTRMALLDNGASEADGSADSRASSHWVRAKDPEWDSTPGGPDVPYAAPPIFDDGSDL